MSDKMKVTECWTEDDEGRPLPGEVSERKCIYDDRPAILMWKEDYDAILKELKELRQFKKEKDEYEFRRSWGGW